MTDRRTDRKAFAIPFVALYAVERYKCGNYDALQLKAAGRATVLIRFYAHANQVRSRSTYPLPSYSFFTLDTLRYVVILTFDHVILIFKL